MYTENREVKSDNRNRFENPKNGEPIEVVEGLIEGGETNEGRGQVDLKVIVLLKEILDES